MPLSYLTDSQLLLDIKNLVSEERKLTHKIIEHLEEIESRKLYSDLKCTSLYDYCMKVLGYSGDEAYRRISAMRFTKRNPEIKAQVSSGKLTLSTLNILDSAQKKTPTLDIAKIAKEVVGKSKREVEALVMPVPAPKQVALNLKLSPQAYDKFQKAKGLLSKYSNEELIEAMADLIIERKEKKLTPQKNSPAPERVSRYIPKAVKAHAYKTTNGKCAICGSSHNLNFNHKTPHALGGTNSKENINLLCHNCNQRQRVVDFGKRISYGVVSQS